MALSSQGPSLLSGVSRGTWGAAGARPAVTPLHGTEPLCQDRALSAGNPPTGSGQRAVGQVLKGSPGVVTVHGLLCSGWLLLALECQATVFLRLQSCPIQH